MSTPTAAGLAAVFVGLAAGILIALAFGDMHRSAATTRAASAVDPASSAARVYARARATVRTAAVLALALISTRTH
jgi:hypothetical protein